MKKTLIIISILCMLVSLPYVSFAAAPAVSLSGPSTVRAGDTITVSVKLSGSSLCMVQGEIQFDSSQLTYQSNSGILAGWKFEIENNNGKISFFGEDDKLSAPINSQKQIFTLTFKVKNVSTGASIKVTSINTAATDRTNDFTFSNASYSVSVSAPISGNANLASLKVNNASVSPQFNKDTTKYTASVPYSVASLDISAKAEHSAAKVSVSNNSLKAGTSTDVLFTVKAENGTSKTYTIKVKRAQDPNYKPSTNNLLSSVSTEGYALSPAFNTNVYSYTVSVPNDKVSLNVRAAAQDGKASVKVEGADKLTAGKDSIIKITCTAEDGTVKEYTITVKRTTISPQVTQSTGSTVTNSNTDISPTGTFVSNTVPPETEKTGTRNAEITVEVPAVIVIALISALTGFIIGLIIGKRRQRD